jgi:polar amino acid transport system substrate-binding protein
MIRPVIGILGIALGVLCDAAPQAADIQRMVSPGKLTYAVNSAFPPFEFLRDGNLTGFDIDMAALIAGRLSLQPSPLMMSFDGMLPALQGGRVDIVNSGMYINAKRQEQAFLVPYLRIGQEIVVHKGNPAKITGRDDLCGKRVGVATGSIMETNAQQDSQGCMAAGKPAVDIMNFPDGASVVALRQGRVDAYYAATPAAVVLVSQFPDDFERAGPTFAANTELGIAVAHDRPDLKAAIEAALAAARADGSMAKIADKYGIPETSLDGL